MHRVVFDTVVFVRALLNPHSRAGRHADSYQLLLSEPTLLDLLAVLRRDELRRLFRTLAGRDPAILVSEDRDLLDLGAYEGIQILSVAEFLSVSGEERGSST